MEFLKRICHIHNPNKGDIYITIITHNYEQTFKVKPNEPFEILDGRIFTLRAEAKAQREAQK